jgi:hypothetical protein
MCGGKAARSDSWYRFIPNEGMPLPATVFAVVFDFLRPTLTNLSLILERDQFARVLLDVVTVGTVICASTSSFGRCSRTQKHYNSRNQRQDECFNNSRGDHFFLHSIVGWVSGLAFQNHRYQGKSLRDKARILLKSTVRTPPECRIKKPPHTARDGTPDSKHARGVRTGHTREYHAPRWAP